ncbi:hypothetical protein POM88_030534 [Heracleum sosnowskyi]|uniref:ABC transporter domain-containing protein n=1 Tax=Heracleum sosnowskyi TaxID=360622 RepID=A0AAD8MI62_9APIA|nr:hypothetical protein POM88_030534 [Heracleum sosnowskyi]
MYGSLLIVDGVVGVVIMPKLLSSLRSCALGAEYALRNALLRQFRSLIFLNIWTRTQLTVLDGPNTFMLHRLPVPRPGQVLGLVGTNGIGKSTALKVLAGKLKPNLGRFNNPPDWQEILTDFRELQNYFTRILEDNLKAIIKPQYVDYIPKAVQGNVGQVLEQKDERDMKKELCHDLELNQAQQLIVVEHDLSVLDYLSDFICCLYGKPGAYGVVTLPFSVREGINIFLAGFVPTENLRFREESLTFKVSEMPQEQFSAQVPLW